MFVVILVTSLVTILVIILSMAFYLVTILCGESDDDSAAAELGIDSQEFNATPVVSPSLDDLYESQQATSQIEEGCYCTMGQQQPLQPGLQAGPQAVAAKSNSPVGQSLILDLGTGVELLASRQGIRQLKEDPEDLKTAEMNSKLLNTSANNVTGRLGEETRSESGLSTSSTTRSDSSNPSETILPNSFNDGAPFWFESQADQKSRILNHLGTVASKQIFDDLDPKEIQLGGTALHWCKTRKSLDKLIKLGIPIEITNKRGETALHVAIRKHKLQVIIGLLIHQANIESRNEYGETPLIVACKVRNIFAVQLLLIFDAKQDTVDRLGQSARHHISYICERSKQAQQTPSAARLILAMLHEIGVERCPVKQMDSNAEIDAFQASQLNAAKQISRTASQISSKANTSQPSIAQTNLQPATLSAPKRIPCTDGCSRAGVYNGNSYNRWSNYKRESLYKRHMFQDLIESKLRQARKGSKKRGFLSRGSTAAKTPSSRLLCIDGGGLRGVIVCQILIEMEQYLKKPMISYFDWMGGTSVGAFIACALCIGTPLTELRRVCFELKDEVFKGERPYNYKFLERVLKRTYGSTTRLSNVTNCKLAITTVLADREPCQLRLFRNYTSPHELLEMHGYAPDTFNNMSGHSVVSQDSTTRRRHSTVATNVKPSSLPRPEQAATIVKTEDTPNGQKHSSTNNAVGAKEYQNNSSMVDANETQPIKQADQRSISLDERGVKSAMVNVASQINTKSPSGNGLDSTRSQEQSNSSKDKQAAETILNENDLDPLMWQAVRASTAAPFFFKPYGPYLDGGILANNPTLDMLNEFESYQKVRKFLKKRLAEKDKGSSSLREQNNALELEPPSKLDIVVSMGTGRGRVIGRQLMVDFGQVAAGFATVFSPRELLRSIRTARDFFRRLMQQSCHTEDYILDRALAWCSSLDIPYFRINPPLATIFSIDDKRDEQLVNALWQTKLYMRSMKDQLKELAELLDSQQ